MNEQPDLTQNAAPSPALSITSLVLGIIALLCGFVAFISVPLGIAAIIFGILGIRKRAGKGMAIAGIITGAIGIIAGLVVSLLVFAAVPALQQNQRDTQVKNDVSSAVASVANFQSNNQGAIPSASDFTSNGFGAEIKYTPGTDCEGISGARAFHVSAKLSDGRDYCQD